MSSLTFTTPSFEDGDDVPKRFTCDGADASPPLSIGSVPEEAVSLAITVEDPIAPDDSFVHWLVWNLPPDLSELPADVAPERKLDDFGGALQGTNGFGDIGYRGPCPLETEAEHTYRFTLYALEEPLEAKGGATRPVLVDDLRAARIETAQFIGIYSR